MPPRKAARPAPLPEADASAVTTLPWDAPSAPTAGSRAPIVRRTTTELVVDALRDRIMAGEFAPGTPLRQELIAEQLGVSRIPVREALRLLSAEGLVDTIAHRGAFVSMLSAQEVRELFDVRLRLEPWLFRDAALQATDADLHKAEAIVAQMDVAEPALWGQLNWQLHEQLYQAAQKPSTLGIIRALHEKSERYFRLQVVNAPIRQQSHQEHLAMIDCCRWRDADRAEAALTRHIEQAATQILSIVERLLGHAAPR